MALKNWALNTVTADTVTDLVQGGVGNEVAIVGLTICNHDASSVATVNVTVTNSSNTTVATLLSGVAINSKSTLSVDVKVFLDEQEKIRVESNLANTSFLASGDESAAS